MTWSFIHLRESSCTSLHYRSFAFHGRSMMHDDDEEHNRLRTAFIYLARMAQMFIFPFPFVLVDRISGSTHTKFTKPDRDKAIQSLSIGHLAVRSYHCRHIYDLFGYMHTYLSIHLSIHPSIHPSTVYLCVIFLCVRPYYEI